MARFGHATVGGHRCGSLHHEAAARRSHRETLITLRPRRRWKKCQTVPSAQRFFSDFSQPVAPKLANRKWNAKCSLSPMENPKKCAHPSCRCAARKDNEYCSTFCEGGAKTADILCSCGHSDCREPAAN